MKKFAMFLGRFQPPHKGHEYLINEALDEGLGALILVRDCPTDSANPIEARVIADILRARWNREDVDVRVVPDVASIRYGRSVGYDISEREVPDDICRISATMVRQMIRDGDDSWRDYIDDSIQQKVLVTLTEETSSED